MNLVPPAGLQGKWSGISRTRLRRPAGGGSGTGLRIALWVIAIAAIIPACTGTDDVPETAESTGAPTSSAPTIIGDEPAGTSFIAGSDSPGTPLPAAGATTVPATAVRAVSLPTSVITSPTISSDKAQITTQTPTPTTTIRDATPTPVQIQPTKLPPTTVSTPTAAVPITATSTPAADPTATPIPTNTPVIATSVPTATPVPIPDDRFGVIASGPGLKWQLDTLGTKWFIDYKSDPRDPPAGKIRVPFISVKPGTARIVPGLIAEYATGAPGSYWYIGGETNIHAQDGISAAAYVGELDYYVGHIKSADPTAKIIGPSVLNWEFTCTGCDGYKTGKTWTTEFVQAYADAHNGDAPPLDVWAIDVYPLTWTATPEYPNPLPMINWSLVVDQLTGFRAYLEDNVPGHANKPIWVTEVASHWAYDSLAFVDGRTAIPANLPYRWEAMNSYVVNLFNWLSDNGPSYSIERWFLYRGFIDIQTNARNGYAGIYLFDSGDPGAPLTPTGEVYSEFAKGIR